MSTKQVKLSDSFSKKPWPYRIVVNQGSDTRYYYPTNARGKSATRAVITLSSSEAWPEELQIMKDGQYKKYQIKKSMSTPTPHESATEKLRRLLKECKVPYNGTCDNVTFWGKGTGTTIAAACQGALWVSTLLTPEQVADKMLRRRVCHNVHEPPKNGLFWPSPHFKCSECGATHVSMDYVDYCPKCGREVVDNW